MTFDEFYAQIIWYTGAPTGTGNNYRTSFSTAEKTNITADLQLLFTNPIAKIAMEQAVSTSPIQLAKGSDSLATSPTVNVNTNSIILPLNYIDNYYYMNNKGQFVKEVRSLSVIHEILHLANPFSLDANPYNTSSSYRGLIVDKQNEVAAGLELNNNIQSSYLAADVVGSHIYQLINQGISYTEGNIIDGTRFGDEPGLDNRDVIDHMNRSIDPNDLLMGFDGRDYIHGGTGKDYIYGGTDRDILDGGDHDDVVYGGDGNDEIHGGNGNDRLYAVEIGQTNGLGGADFSDIIYGDVGDDIIWGGGGGDFLYGGADKDELHGGNGVDILDGGDGDDKLYGDDGNDIFATGVGNDKFYGGSGSNTFYFDTTTSGEKTFIKDAPATNTLAASENDSQITLDKSGNIPGIDVITGGAFSNVAVNLKADAGDGFWDFKDVNLEKLELRGSASAESIRVKPGDYTVKTGGAQAGWADLLVVETDQNLTVTASGTLETGLSGSQLTYTGSGVFYGGTGNDVYYLKNGLYTHGGGGSDAFVLQESSTPNYIAMSLDGRFSDTNSVYVRSLSATNKISSIDIRDYFDDGDLITTSGVTNTGHYIELSQYKSEAFATITIYENLGDNDGPIKGDYITGTMLEGLWSNYGISMNTDSVSSWEIDRRIMYGPDATNWAPRSDQAIQVDAQSVSDFAVPLDVVPNVLIDDVYVPHFSGKAFIFESKAIQGNDFAMSDLFDRDLQLPETAMAGNLEWNLQNVNSFLPEFTGDYVAYIHGNINNTSVVTHPADDFRFV